MWKTAQKPIKQGLNYVDNIVEMWICLTLFWGVYRLIIVGFCLFLQQKKMLRYIKIKLKFNKETKNT